MQNTMTRAWELYELGRAYNNQLEPNQYSLVNTQYRVLPGQPVAPYARHTGHAAAAEAGV